MDKDFDKKDYKLYGLELIIHRISMELELLGDIIFESEDRKESIFHMMIMSLLGLGLLIFLMDDAYNELINCFNGLCGSIGVFFLITLLYYLSWQVGSKFRTYLLASTLPVIFTMITMYVYVNIKLGLDRETVAYKYLDVILVVFIILSFFIGVCDYIITRIIKRIRRENTKKDIQRGYRKMYLTLIENEPENVSYEEITTMNSRYNLGFTEEFMKKACKS